jgi:AcrR family transcriptional regulator
VPVLAGAFAELGYRRATTAALAERCGLRENQLYRLWPNKKAMFLASIDYLYEYSAEKWRTLLAQDDGVSPAERILSWEGEHRGESGLHRITFAGLNETDDPDISKALQQMYRKFHKFIAEQVKEHRGLTHSGDHPDTALTAWAVIGMGMMVNITHELDLLNRKTQGRLLHDVGKLLLEGDAGA